VLLAIDAGNTQTVIGNEQYDAIAHRPKRKRNRCAGRCMVLRIVEEVDDRLGHQFTRTADRRHLGDIALEVDGGRCV